MALLYLVRHGVAEEAVGRAVGRSNLPLAPAGALAIARLAARWQGPPPDRLETSDLARAVASAAILERRWGLRAVLDPRLREMDFGRWDGWSWEEIHRRDPGELAAWGECWWEARTPEGEGFQDLTRRVVEWFEERFAHGPPPVTAAVVHAGSLRALLMALGGVSRQAAWDLRLDYARVTGFEVGSARRVETLFVNRKGWCAPEDSNL